MSKYTPEQVRVAKAILKYGSAYNSPSDAPDHAKRKALDTAGKLLRKGYDADTLYNAARYGMGYVFPYNRGEPWTARDFRKKVGKAVAAANKLNNMGRIPVEIDKLRRDNE